MIEFKVSKRSNWSPRFVACRVAQCIGTGDPLAWEDGDQGPPFWEPDEERWTINSGNDFWLRIVREEEDGTVYSLNYRYSTAAGRQEALEALGKWLESDFNFGDYS